MSAIILHKTVISILTAFEGSNLTYKIACLDQLLSISLLLLLPVPLVKTSSYQNCHIFFNKLCSVLYGWLDTRYKKQRLRILHSHNVFSLFMWIPHNMLYISVYSPVSIVRVSHPDIPIEAPSTPWMQFVPIACRWQSMSVRCNYHVRCAGHEVATVKVRTYRSQDVDTRRLTGKWFMPTSSKRFSFCSNKFISVQRPNLSAV